MIPAAFDYVAPATVEEAVRALAAGGEDAKVMAGGQSLIPVLRMRLAVPTVVVDLSGLTELTGVHDDGDSLRIGAMTTHHEVQRDPLVREHARLLRLATDTVADPQVRHRGTFGGSLAHADPAGDLLAPALALDAVMVCAGPDGTREVPAAEFFVDFFTTALAPDELLTHVKVPKL
ncbi:MAG: xanthine dehydrogenase family protein subunit M, partial [Saccharothrix sp.]|nr:xanthine dehydrogenase family protein subunit M [Saccharothrix sp.]